MKRIQPQMRSWPVRVLLKLFIIPSRNPPSLSIINAIAQAVLFTCLVSLQPVGKLSDQTSEWALFLQNTQCETVYIIILALLISLVARGLLGISLVRLMYVPISSILLTSTSSIIVLAIAWFLLLLNIIIDILSHIEFSFCTKNNNCQTINLIKVLHYGVIGCALWFCYISPNYLPQSIVNIVSQGISLVIFAVLLFAKSRSKQHSYLLKEIYIRFYALTASIYVKNIICIWFNPMRPQITTLIALIGSQILYSIAKLALEARQKRKQDEVHNLVNNVDTFFQIYAYLYSDTYEQHLQHLFAAFCQQDTGKLLQSAGAHQIAQDQPIQPYFNQRQTRNSPFRTLLQGKIQVKNAHQLAGKTSLIQQLNRGRRNSQMMGISAKTKSLLKQAMQDSECNRFKCLLLGLQIDYAVNHNIIGLLQKLYEMKQECRKLFWIQRLCIIKHIMKLELMIKQSYTLSCNSPPLYVEFFRNEQIRTNILKSSFQHLQLFRYISSPTSSILFSKLSTMLRKMLNLAQKTDQMYNDTHIKCKDLELLYIDHLYMVRRDVEKATAMFRTISIFQQARNWLNIDNKIYLCLGIQHTNVFVQNVGINLRKLLGFDRSSVKNGSMSVFLPAFYQQSHSKKLEQAFDLPTSDIQNFSRETIIKHNDGYYLPINLQLKLVCCPKTGKLFFEGYIQINEDPGFNWMNYFFENIQEERIIEIGAPLKDIIQLPPNKFVYVNEFFDNQRSPSMCSLTSNEGKLTDSRQNNQQNKYLYHNGVEYQYQKIKNLQGMNSSYTYYVCANSHGRASEGQLGKSQPFQNYCSEFLKYQKYPTKYQDCDTHLDEFFAAKTQIKHKINSKLVLCLMVIVVLIIMAGVAMQTMLIAKVHQSRAQNEAIVADFDNFVEFYHQIDNFGLILSKAYFMIGKSKSYNYPYYNIQKLCLNLQSRNEMIAKYQETTSGTKPYKEYVNELLAIVYQSLYIIDIKTRTLVSNSITAIINGIWGAGHQRNLQNYLQQASKSISQDNKVKLVVGGCLGFLIFAVYFIIIKVQSIKRQNQYESLNLLCGLNAAALLAHSAEEFLRRTVGGISEHDFSQINRETFKQEGGIVNKTSLTSGISARENSVRGFFEQSMINSTNRQSNNLRNASSIPYNTLELKEKIEENETARKQQKIQPRSKLFMLIWTIFLLLSLGFVVGSIIVDQAGSQISLSRSIVNLEVLLRRQIDLSSTITQYLTSVAQGNQSNDYMTSLQQYNTSLSTTIDFDEIRSTDFKNFTDYYQNFNYVYLCEYMACDSKYKAQINIIYSSAVHMITNFMANNPNPNVSLASDNAQVDLIFYAHYLLQNTTYLILKSYISDFTVYQQNKYSKINLFYDLQLTAFILYAIMALGFYLILFRKQRAHCTAILNIVKEESYQTPETNQ